MQVITLAGSAIISFFENVDSNHFSTRSGIPSKPDFFFESIVISKLSS
jgi:hypothetical protein